MGFKECHLAPHQSTQLTLPLGGGPYRQRSIGRVQYQVRLENPCRIWTLGRMVLSHHNHSPHWPRMVVSVENRIFEFLHLTTPCTRVQSVGRMQFLDPQISLELNFSVVQIFELGLWCNHPEVIMQPGVLFSQKYCFPWISRLIKGLFHSLWKLWTWDTNLIDCYLNPNLGQKPTMQIRSTKLAPNFWSETVQSPI